MAADTVGAAIACPDVRRVTVVTDDGDVGSLVSELGARVVADEPDAGINAALRHGMATLSAEGDGIAVAALAADLPALRPTDLSLALRAARRSPQSFVTDSAGTGTTMYATISTGDFDPRFGPRSAIRHALDAVSLDVDVPSLRRD